VAGTYYVLLDVEGKGFAMTEEIADMTITAELYIDEGNMPDTTMSSYAGGQHVTFHGFGFDEHTMG